MTRSLRIGSDTLGWQEFADAALLGVRTRTMPGGDGSLEFAIPGDVAWRRRNVLVPEAEVVLTVDGEVDFGGYLSCDPLRHRLGAQDTLELTATGPWGMAGRSATYSHLCIDPDLDRWQQYRGIHERSGRFTVSREGFLELRASTDRSYDTDDACRLYYWLDDGLSDNVLSGVVFEYKLNLPSSNWEASISAGSDPTTAASGLALSNCYWQGPLTVSSWTRVVSQTSVFTCLLPCYMLNLYKVGGTGSPSSEPYIRVRFSAPSGAFAGGLCGYFADTYTPDNDVSIADILAAIADDCGVPAARQRIDGLSAPVNEFVVRYPATISDALAQATALANAPLEVYFDRVAEGFRFTANERPATVNMARNRLWVVGGRGGEDVSGLQRDWEATPEQVEVLYAVQAHATFPDGLVRAARYPASSTSAFPLIETVDLTGEPPMTAATAAQYAENIYRARQESLYAGDVVLPETARTATGQEVPTVKLRPGDRIKPTQLLDVDSAGLYVQAVSYDFTSATCTATVGEPWDPLGFRPRALAKPRLALAAAHPGRGGPGAYFRRSGVA